MRLALTGHADALSRLSTGSPFSPLHSHRESTGRTGQRSAVPCNRPGWANGGPGRMPMHTSLVAAARAEGARRGSRAWRSTERCQEIRFGWGAGGRVQNRLGGCAVERGPVLRGQICRETGRDLDAPPSQDGCRYCRHAQSSPLSDTARSPLGDTPRSPLRRAWRRRFAADFAEQEVILRAGSLALSQRPPDPPQHRRRLIRKDDLVQRSVDLRVTPAGKARLFSDFRYRPPSNR